MERYGAVLLSAAVALSILTLGHCLDIRNPKDKTPYFDVHASNVTVKEGDMAILPCDVFYVGRHQVVWSDSHYTVLTTGDRRIIDDDRISLERQYIKSWNLQIRDVTHEDEGVYMCQVNTNPVKIKTVLLIVKVPARILENGTTSSQSVSEGETVHLECRTTGIPEPTVRWRRLVTNNEGEQIQSEFCLGTKNVGKDGEVLIIYNISRECGDTYLCVASNGIGDAVSRSIPVKVVFAPEIKMRNKKMGQYLHKETILDCTITANPQVMGKWMKDGVEIKTTPSKYRITPYNEDRYSITLSLRVQINNESDFGIYTCIGSNELGQESGDVELYDYSVYKRTHLVTSTSTTTRLPSQYPNSRQHHTNGGDGDNGYPGYTNPGYIYKSDGYDNNNQPMDGRLRYEAGNSASGSLESGAGQSRGGGNGCSNINLSTGQGRIIIGIALGLSVVLKIHPLHL